jgi:hypothetical protein
VVDVLHQVLDDGAPRAEEAPDAGDADDAAGGGARLDLVVADVALVVAQRAGVRVGEDDRGRRGVHRLQRRPVPGVRAVHEHPHAVHLADDVAAERREPPPPAWLFRL